MRYIIPTDVMKTRFVKHPSPFWKIAIICFRDYSGSNELVDALGAKPLGYKVIWGMEESSDDSVAHEIDINGVKVGVIAKCQWGGPQTAIVVEELAAIGVQIIIGVGAVGSIREDLPRGSQVVITSALQTDGTSRNYCESPSFSCPDFLVSVANDCSKKMGVPLVPVTAATVDAIYRETDIAVKNWAAMGAQAINMEVAPFYAASQACDILSLWIGHVSDCLVARNWESWDNINSMTRESGCLALHVVKRLVSNKKCG